MNQQIDSLRFSSEILRRLGEELNPHIDQGIIELVRNAYDADATTCRVELADTAEAISMLRVTDDGDGMTQEAIRNGWLVLGRSEKANRLPTRLNRLPVGNKGLGRLAALRMGTLARLSSRPRQNPGVENTVLLDWERFDQADTVENVQIEICSGPTSQPQGTTIEICQLRRPISKQDVQRLARSLLLLADPFDHSSGFRPVLVAPEFVDMERRVRHGYFDEAEYKLVAELDANGIARAQVTDRHGEVLFVAQQDDLLNKKSRGSTYNTVPAKFELWAFKLDSEKLTGRSLTKTELKEWLDITGGIHIYQRGMRVHPYGDPGHDWLEMNLSRSRSPEERPSTNNSIGRVTILDDERLIQKTDRSGFVENKDFSELKRFASDALNWMAKVRLAEASKRRIAEKTQTSKQQEEAEEAVTKALTAVSPEVRETVEKAVVQLQRANEREVKLLREDLQLYRTLATVGTTAAVFAHESGQLITSIKHNAVTIERRGRKELGLLYSSILEQPINILISASNSLRNYASIPIHLLKRSKRVQSRVSLHKTIRDVIEWFQPFFAQLAINCELNLQPSDLFIAHGSIASIESIITNLVTNSINAFTYSEVHTLRRIVISTDVVGANITLCVTDSGPGITKLDISDIWLPGKTTTPSGTGLGLTIVRDIVADLGGKITAIPHGSLGGAEFTLKFPLVEEKNASTT